MSADTALAEARLRTRVFPGQTIGRGQNPPSRRGRKVNAARGGYPHAVPAAAALLEDENRAIISPRVFAGLVRFGEFALALRPRLRHRLFLRRRLLPPVRRRPCARRLRLQSPCSKRSASTPSPPSPHLIASFRACWSAGRATVGLLLAGVFFLKLAPEFSRVWLALWYTARRRRPHRLPRGRRRADQARPRPGPPHAPRHRLRHRPRLRAACSRPSTPIPHSDIRVCGVFDDRGLDRASPSVAGYPNLGNLDALMQFCRRARIDMLVVALPVSARRRACCSSSRSFGCCRSTSAWPAQASQPALRAPRLFVRRHRAADRHHRPADRRLERRRQVAVRQESSPASRSLALAPAMALVALAVKLDSKGPVLFRQKRYGFNNELIEVYKFRSMFADQADANAARLVTKGDPRVTRVGRFIRKTSLDELPQLFNVLKGELSLVGPRPHALRGQGRRPALPRRGRRLLRPPQGQARHHRLGADQRLARRDRHARRRPSKRVEHDLYYIDNWSVLLRPLHPPQDARSRCCAARTPTEAGCR